MKRIYLVVLLLSFICTLLTGCSSAQTTHLDPKQPVSLTMWHIYGEQSESPMDALLDEFNETVGKEKGIVIDVTLLSNTLQIGQKLADAKAHKPGSLDIPDLFFCKLNDALDLGTDNLIDWNNLFSAQEISAFSSSSLASCQTGSSLLVLPVTESTHLLFINGTAFKRFSEATHITYDDLSTWNGFFRAAKTYQQYSGGAPFCAFDYILQDADLYARGNSATSLDLYANNWYNPNNGIFKTSWLTFSEALANRTIIVSDRYANTQIMTGEVLMGACSSTAVMYCNDRVTYPNNVVEPMNLHILPMPQNPEVGGISAQTTFGLCGYKTSPQKEEAANVFAHWLSQKERNLTLCTATGYYPVVKEACAELSSHQFSAQEYTQLYSILSNIALNYECIDEPTMPGYNTKTQSFSTALKKLQEELPNLYATGSTTNDIVEDSWNTLLNIAHEKP